MESHPLRRPGAPFGPLLEGFAISELARQLTWSQELVDLYHYRDHDKVEVDAVLENRQGKVVGIEVKAASTVRSEDFHGLRRLEDRLGEDFVVGAVLYTGNTTLPFGPKLRAMPISVLWQLPPDGFRGLARDHALVVVEDFEQGAVGAAEAPRSLRSPGR